MDVNGLAARPALTGRVWRRNSSVVALCGKLRVRYVLKRVSVREVRQA